MVNGHLVKHGIQMMISIMTTTMSQSTPMRGEEIIHHIYPAIYIILLPLILSLQPYYFQIKVLLFSRLFLSTDVLLGLDCCQDQIVARTGLLLGQDCCQDWIVARTGLLLRLDCCQDQIVARTGLLLGLDCCQDWIVARTGLLLRLDRCQDQIVARTGLLLGLDYCNVVLSYIFS